MEEDAVLLAVVLAELQAGDLGDGVGLVGRLKRGGEQAFLRHRLGGLAGIDAGAAKEEESLHTLLPSGMDRVVGDRQVLVEELGGVGVVGVDSSDACGGDDDDIRLLFLVKLADSHGIAQVEFLAVAKQQVFEPARAQGADNGRSDHAAVSCDMNARGGLHEFVGLSGAMMQGYGGVRDPPIPPAMP